MKTQHDWDYFFLQFARQCAQPVAPHLRKEGRVWCRVSITGVTKHKRPDSQGGLWYTSLTLKVLEVL